MRSQRKSFLAACVVLGATACGSTLPVVGSPREEKRTKSVETASAGSRAKAKTSSSSGPMSFEDELLARANQSIPEKRPRRGETRGRSRAITPFRLEALPISVLATPFPTKNPPGVVEGTSAKEVVTKKNDYGYSYGYGYPAPRSFFGVRVSAEGWSSGSIRIGSSVGFFGLRNGMELGGVNVACGKDEPNQLAHWEGFVEKGEARSYVIVEGWFDAKNCRAVDLQRVQIPLAEIVPNVLYGYRQCDDATCSAKTSVGFVIPAAISLVMQGEARNVNQGPGTRVVVPVVRGVSHSLLAGVEIGRGAMRELSVEILQSVSDPEPIATAFLDAAK